MTGLFGAAILLAAVASASNDAVRLDPGEFRWSSIHVRKVPAEISCRFEVVQGGPTVHAELVPMDEFRAFVRHHAYEKLAETRTGRSGQLSQIAPDRGDYAIVIVNAEHAPPALVSLYIETNVNPAARTLPPRRRLAVILISFAIFIVSVGWSGHRLIRAMKNAGQW